MDALSPDRQDTPRASAWWREPEIFGLILLVAVVYFFRAGDAPLRGEETRWALVAQEMARSGDWIVPRVQDEPFLNRPPLHCWLIAATGAIRGQWDALTFRLPSLVATLVSTVLVYGYARVFLSRLGALAAAAALATMAELLQTCRLAETDALFIPLVAASLLVWHWGYSRNWPAACTWPAAYGLMALAALTKGPQAPIYFVGSIGVYLVLKGQWRRLFTLAHLLGIGVAALLIGAWFVPLAMAQGWAEACAVWTEQTALRMQSWTVGDVAWHMVRFPLEVLGCTMPWSVLLAAYFSRRFRTHLGAARPAVLFATVCLAVAFPTCWVPPEAKSRYLTPLYPCLAVLIGLVVERCAQLEPAGRLRTYWNSYVYFLTGLMVIFGLALFGAVAFGNRSSTLAWVGPFWRALLYSATALVLAYLAFAARRSAGPKQIRTALLAIAGFMGLIVTNIVTDFHIGTNPDTNADVSQVRSRLPEGAALVSLDPIHHRFAYFFGKPIGHTAWPKSASELPQELEYFCFDAPPATRAAIPFAWEEIAVVSMERKRRDEPKEVVIVGRRVRDGEATSQESVRPGLRAGLTAR